MEIQFRRQWHDFFGHASCVRRVRHGACDDSYARGRCGENGRPNYLGTRHTALANEDRQLSQSAALITPQANLAPELPAGSVFKSSSFSCTITDFPMIEFGPLRSSFPFQLRCPLPEASASILPKSPA